MANKLTVAEKIRDLFKSAFGDAFRMYRVGDPIIPPQSELPAVYVTETSVDFSADATGYDAIKHHIFIQLVLNKKDELGRPVDGNTLDTIIDNFIYGRDLTTNEYATNSVMGVLRKNFTLDGLSVNTIGNAKKGVVPRPQDMLTAEGQIDFTVDELQPVNNRS
jgi:hypothetical protein